MRRALAYLLTALLALGVPQTIAWAGDKSPPSVTAREKADMKLVTAVAQRVSREGPGAVAHFERQLLEVIARAPTHYPLVERREGYAIVRGDGSGPLELMLLLEAASEKRSYSVVRQFNTYGHAYLQLASFAVETKRPQLAIDRLDTALAMQPDNPHLILEKATALEMLRRPGDALTLIDSWLPEHELLAPLDEAILLRARGYALIELGRLDEAESAYNRSLELQPGHKGAEAELKFIANARVGKANYGPVQVMTSDKAAEYGSEATSSSGPPSPR